MNTQLESLANTPQPAQHKAQPTALIVDDNWDNRMVGRMVLENAGYAVKEATNGGEALMMLAEQLFDLMVLDLQMPVMDGEEVLEYLRVYDIYNDMPVIVTTAYDETVTRKLAHLTPYILHRPLSVIELMTLTFKFRTAVS